MWVATGATAVVSLAAVAIVCTARTGNKTISEWPLIRWFALGAPVLAALGAGWVCTHFALFPVWFLSHIAAMLICWCFMICGISVNTTLTSDRSLARLTHGVVQTVALLAAVVGYYCMYHQHSVVMPSSQFGLDPGNTKVRIAHVWLGYVVIIGILVQGCQGWLKYANLLKYRLHPRFGTLLVVLAGVNVAMILSSMLVVPSYVYWLVQGSILGASVLAALIACGYGKADARELPEVVVEGMGIEEMYKQLPAPPHDQPSSGTAMGT